MPAGPGGGGRKTDRALEIEQRGEGATLEPPTGQLGEETVDRVQPRARGRRELEREARLAGEPRPDLRVLIGSRSSRG